MTGFFPDLDDHDAGGQRIPLPSGILSKAVYSGPRNCYRLSLTRIWDATSARALLLWIMLNPSVATEYVDDRTLVRCRKLSQLFGYRGMIICNLSPYRSTKPEGLLTAEVPVHTQENMRTIQAMLAHEDVANHVMCGWGDISNRKLRAQMMPVSAWVATLLQGRGRTLRLTTNSMPWHPLYSKTPQSAAHLLLWPPQ